jgi:CRP/FNR family cyclic AMP-dependent transcriptional regulator
VTETCHIKITTVSSPGQSEAQIQYQSSEFAVASDQGFGKILASLPLTTFRAGDTVLSAGTKSGRLLVLKSGAVTILKDSIEIAKVEEPGAVFGELSALLDVPHTADVRALTDSQFHVADAALLGKGPAALLEVARILARRIVAANKSVVELRSQIQAGRSPSVLGKLLEKVEEVLSVGGASFET